MTGRAVGGAPGRAERFPAPGSTRARGPGGGATVLVNGGARRAHHPSDRSLPIEVGGGDPQDPPRVPAGRDDEEEEGGARALLPEDLPPVVGTPGPGEGGGQVWVSPAAGRVRRRREGGAPSGLPRERLVDDGVRGGRPGAVLHRVGRPGAGGRLVRAFHEHRDLAHLQVLVRRV